ncbi:MAG: amidohydrolase family protein [Bacillota bacterium]
MAAINDAGNRAGPIWDTHVHLFPEKMMQAIFRFFREQYGWQLPFSANPDRLLEYLREQGICRVFALAYVHKPNLSRQVNRWLAELADRYPWVVPFGAVHPLDDELGAVVREALDLYGFAGLKLHCLVQQIRPDDRRLDPVYQALTERGRGLIIHASSFPLPAENYLGISYVSRLMQNHPGLKMVVPHLGLYDLQGYRHLLDLYPDLYLDTAFVFQNRGLIPPLREIKELLLAFPNRVLYGSDYPFILEPPQNGISRIKELKLPASIDRQLFFANAAKFLSDLAGK